MKSENEIRSKINSLLDLANKTVNNSQFYEAICCQIDALMWVIGYENQAAPLLDEREMPKEYIK